MEDLRTFATTHGISTDDGTDPALNGALRVLLVDDDPVFATYLRQIIAAACPDARAEWASDGFEAEQLTTTFQPQLLVTDLYMARVDGIELCRRPRTSPTTAKVNLVILSDSLTDENITALRAAGADRWLRKSSPRDEILRALGISVPPRAIEAPAGTHS